MPKDACGRPARGGRVQVTRGPGWLVAHQRPSFEPVTTRDEPNPITGEFAPFRRGGGWRADWAAAGESGGGARPPRARPGGGDAGGAPRAARNAAAERRGGHGRRSRGGGQWGRRAAAPHGPGPEHYLLALG